MVMVSGISFRRCNSITNAPSTMLKPESGICHCQTADYIVKEICSKESRLVG
jgi:hypothetical protein